MISNAIQLKAKVRNLSKGDNDSARTLLRIFFMERFLERLSVSKYRNSFVLKGGMLTASLVGVNLRGTMDIDATVIAVPLAESEIQKIVKDICCADINDCISFEIIKTETIMDDFEYPGIRLHLVGIMDNLRQPIKLDISTDDAITPAAIEYNYRLLFEDREIQLKSYNIETLLAEKAQTIIARGLANTRMRDFYDIYEVTRKIAYSSTTFSQAFDATCRKRDSVFSEERIMEEIDNFRNSNDMEKLWERFCKKNYYVESISWNTIVESVEGLLLNLQM